MDENKSYASRAVGVLFTQMTAKEGIKKHGEFAIAALVKEFKQLVDGAMEGKPVVWPIVYSTLSKKEKYEALEAINLIKEKGRFHKRKNMCEWRQAKAFPKSR